MIKKSVLQTINEHPQKAQLVADIVMIRGVDYQTVERWLNTNHVHLMNILILKRISKLLNISVDALYQE